MYFIINTLTLHHVKRGRKLRKETRKGRKIEVNNLHKSQPIYCVSSPLLHSSHANAESNNFFMLKGRKREH